MPKAEISGELMCVPFFQRLADSAEEGICMQSTDEAGRYMVHEKLKDTDMVGSNAMTSRRCRW